MLFDGVCNFCNASVNLILRNDKKNHFLFAALQSETGIALQQKYGLPFQNIQSIVLIKNEKVFLKSDAALKIASLMGFPWNILSIFLLLPRFFRNAVYDWVARNRYKWFGKRNTCRIPSVEEKAKFL